MASLVSLARNTSLVLIVALACAAVGLTFPASGSAQTDEPSLAIDAGVSGNEATVLGELEDCIEVETGSEFQVDVTVRDVTELLAWETPIDYDPEVLVLVGQDVKMFQQANPGSSVIDISAKLPDDSGYHSLSAFESADPPVLDSGSGVLARITFEAVGPGESAIRFGNRDLNSDGELDSGTLLKNGKNPPEVIGDDNGDNYFDGEKIDATVVVDGVCPAGSVVAAPVDQPDSGDDSSPSWLIIAAGAAGAVIVLGGLAALLLRRRSRTPPAATP